MIKIGKILTFREIGDLVKHFVPDLDLKEVRVVEDRKPYWTSWTAQREGEIIELPSFYLCNQCGYVVGADLEREAVISGRNALEVESAFESLEGYEGADYKCGVCKRIVFMIDYCRS